MISADKQLGALRAIQSIFVSCRALAYENKSAEFAQILDVAEYLPGLMIDPRSDCTDSFRDNLVGLAEKYPLFNLALHRFDHPHP